MTNLNARIADLEKRSGGTQPILVYDDGQPNEAREQAIARAQASKRVIVRVSPTDAAL